MRIAFPLATLAVLLRAGAAGGQTFSVTLSSAPCVPSSPSPATGYGRFDLDADKNLTFEVHFVGLQGRPVLVNVHGPAHPGETGPQQFVLPASENSSGSLGQLFETQEAWLQGGLLYLEAHTSAYQNCEVRGQILNTVGVEDRTWTAVRTLYR